MKMLSEFELEMFSQKVFFLFVSVIMIMCYTVPH